jgi:hypothetical protein
MAAPANVARLVPQRFFKRRFEGAAHFARVFGGSCAGFRGGHPAGRGVSGTTTRTLLRRARRRRSTPRPSAAGDSQVSASNAGTRRGVLLTTNHQNTLLELVPPRHLRLL